MADHAYALPLHLTAATLLRISAEGLATALVLTVQARTGDAATAGFLQTAMTLPYVLSGPVIGHALDRTRRPGRFVAAVAAGYAVAMAALLTIAGDAPLYAALAVALVIGLTEPVVVAVTGLLPRFVPADRLPRAYGLEAASYNVAAITGPALAATIATATAADFSGLPVMAGALLGALALVFLPAPGPAAMPARPKRAAHASAHDTGAPAPPRPVRPDDRAPERTGALLGGAQVLLRNRVLRGLTLATTFASVGLGGIAVTTVLLGRRLGGDEASGGRLLVALAAGSLLGSLLSSRLLTARYAEPVMLGGLVAFGTALASLAVVPDILWATVACAAAGLFEGPAFAATLMLRQREAPPGRLGQVNTTAGSLKIGASAIGAALTGALAERVGPFVLIAGIGAFPLIGVVAGLLVLRGQSLGRRYEPTLEGEA
ncbi:enterobactin exporter EntS [Actinomadura rubteroloni]|uniref:Enterobactin exporter EntS n=1 Tax=Actinomadura rubteroloni TaxID=1926885 RepID=A0A2P4UMB4_9ACTN|nr:MFS transporter [Actinomadura rubteroloni]POM26188.1 enterobactin exporter EntS [Actinomadura rubteroloni]